MFKNISKILGMPSSEQAYYLFFDEVTMDSCRSCIEWILECNFAEKKPKMLNLIICSPGGDLVAAFGLIDIMRGSSIPISTIAIGGIASAGTLIFMSGERGHRVLAPNTSVMSHQYTSGMAGKEHELLSTVKEFELTADRLVTHYKKCTGLDEKTIKLELLPPHDVWLKPDEAVEYGIADEIKSLK